MLLISLVNLLSIFFTIASLLLIEPLMKIIFQGEVGVFSPITDFLLQPLLHFFHPEIMRSLLPWIALLMLLLYFMKNLFQYLSQWLMAPIRSGIVRNLRQNIFRKIVTLPLSYFSSQKKGDIISRAVNDTQEVEFTFIRSIQQLLLDPLSILLYLTTLFIVDWQLTLFVLFLLPLAGLLIGRVSRSLRRRSREVKTILGVLISKVEETIQGLRVIKGFNAQQFSENAFNKENQTFANKQKTIYRFTDLASPLSEFLGVTVVMIILVFGGIRVLSADSSLTPALFITYITIFTQVIPPAKNLSTAVSNYNRGLATFDRIKVLFSADEVIRQSDHARPVTAFNDSIQLKDVNFSYDQTEVLKEINFSVSKGKIVAIVGHSGAGKSTLVDLLPRFYDVSAGAILLDGINIKDYIIDDLRSLFSLVSQDIILFNDTIYNNIAFGMKDTDEQKVIEAAIVANAYSFILSLPDGFQTNIGDRGLTLSGGQRQRISIARAVLRNAPILILDEATSAMDTESERLVQQALDTIMQGRTTFVIAHRLSTIQHADTIIVLDKGKIVESGSHEELMKLSCKYAKLVEINTFQK